MFQIGYVIVSIVVIVGVVRKRIHAIIPIIMVKPIETIHTSSQSMRNILL